MSRYTGPRVKKMRALGIDLPGLSRKTMWERAYPPGEHGPRNARRRRESDFKKQLVEKQKLRFNYGLTEKQFRRLFVEAKRDKAPTPDKLEAQPARDVALLIGFDITAGEFRGQLQLALPLAALESHRERFAPPRRSAETGPGWEPYFRRELRAVPLELTGVLCTRDYALADLLALRVGSVLPLEMPADVELLVEGEPFARGSYGSHEGRKAIKITRLALAKAASNGGKS